MDKYALILASKSPRRIALLSLLGVRFIVDVANIDEEPSPAETPDGLATRLSQEKARAVARRHPAGVVLAADTVVAIDGGLLGKPTGAGHAVEMLKALRGRRHSVYTAVTAAAGERLETRLSVSEVLMRNYSDDEIAVYISSGDPLDKAGAYAIQHEWFAPVADWAGCYTGIMGLPLGFAAELLRWSGFVDEIDVVGTCETLAGQCCWRDGLGAPRSWPEHP